MKDFSDNWEWVFVFVRKWSCGPRHQTFNGHLTCMNIILKEEEKAGLGSVRSYVCLVHHRSNTGTFLCDKNNNFWSFFKDKCRVITWSFYCSNLTTWEIVGPIPHIVYAKQTICNKKHISLQVESLSHTFAAVDFTLWLGAVTLPLKNLLLTH